MHEKMQIAYKSLVGKSEWKRPVGRRRYRWKDNVKIYFKGTGCEGVDWIHLVQKRV
jgi:hypothetical protein